MNNYKIKEDYKNDIINRYLNNETSISIAKDYNVDCHTVLSFLKRHNVQIKNKSEASRKYQVNETFFDEIDTPEKAYFLGMLMADGNNSGDRRNYIQLSLVEEDKYLLETLNSLIHINRPLYFKKPKKETHKPAWILYINNKRIADKLNQYGISKAKTFSTKFPYWLDKSLYRYFILGAFDGDGCISLYYSKQYNCYQGHWNYVGYKDLLLGIKDILETEVGINCRINDKHPSANKGILLLEVTGNQQILKLFNYLYYNAPFYLKRKYDKFLQIKEQDLLRKNKPIRTCIICGDRHESLGYCRKHYDEFIWTPKRKQQKRA